jgi:hypothetical protein
MRRKAYIGVSMLAVISRVAVFAVLLLLVPARWAEGQVTVGGALVFARTTAEPDEPGTFSPPPSGTEPGAIIFGGAALSRRVGLQGELSVPRRTSTTRKSSYSSGDFTDTTVHRDILLSGLVRVRASSWCELLAGAGVVFASTSATSVAVDRETGVAWTTEKHLPDTTRLALTAGGDFPIRFYRKVWLLPTARIHYLSRAELEPPPGIDSRPIGRAGKIALRVGIGAMVAF